MLGDTHFTESSLPQLVADSVEVWRRHDWLTKLVELVDYHRHDVLLVLEEGVCPLGRVDLRRVVLSTARFDHLPIGLLLSGSVLLLA